MMIMTTTTTLMMLVMIMRMIMMISPSKLDVLKAIGSHFQGLCPVTGQDHPGQGLHAIRHPLTQKALGDGPGVSSITLLSSTSQALRASRRLLPSIISSTETPSYHSHSTHVSDNSDEQEETLSLPSSISRFHASRVQFPTLLPDAMYPLTSTKAAYSPSLPCHDNNGRWMVVPSPFSPSATL